MTGYSARKILYIIFIAAFIVKILSGLFLSTGSGPETFEYEMIADNILDGKGFLFNYYGREQRAFVQPFYPIFTAIIYRLTNHSQSAILMIQSVASSALCFIIYSIAIRFTEKREALLAAAATAFHPGITVYSVLKLHPLVFDIFLYLLTVCLIVKFIQKPDNRNAVLAGIIIGLAVLSRSTILPFVFLSLIYAFFILREIQMRTKIRYLFIICFVAALVYLPWIIRNYKVFNEFVFMQTCSGENLWMGNNEIASGSAVLSSGESVQLKMPQTMRRDLEGLDELGQQRYFTRYFLNFVRRKPLLFARLFVKKFYYFWWFAPQTGVFYNTSWLYVYRTYYTALFALFLFGFLSLLKDRVHRGVIVLLSAYMLSLALLHAIVNVDTRHRWAVEPIMIIFASIGFFALWNFIKGKFRWIRGT